MKKSLVVATAAVALVGVGAHSPASAAKPKKKPITKSYSMTLPPLPDPLPSGTSCTREAVAGQFFHDEKLTTTGAGTLTVELTGFAGDWDITVFDADGLVGQGDGTSTGGTGVPATNGKDTFVASWKKGTTITVRSCNFAGSPQAKGSYTFTYK